MDVVLNWLWQGGIVALAAAAGLRVLPQSRAQIRYWFVWAAYAAVLTLPAVPHILTVASPATAPAEWGPRDPVVAMPLTWWTSPTLILALWIAWFGVNAARLSAAVAALRATKEECRACPVEVEARLPLWSRVRSTGRRTRLVISSRVRSAAVLGWGEPVIALAPGLLDRLDPPDLDRVVLHEWAHVQRRDDRAQLVQQLLRTAVGWHPAIWWLERQMELEREVACDEITVALTGSAKQYAACLAALAALPGDQGGPVPVLSAAAPSGLRRRVIRMLSAHVVTYRRACTIGVCISLTLVPIALAVGAVRAIEPTVGLAPLVAPPPRIAPMAPPPIPVGAEAQSASVARQAPSRRPPAPDEPKPVKQQPPPPEDPVITARAIGPLPVAVPPVLPLDARTGDPDASQVGAPTDPASPLSIEAGTPGATDVAPGGAAAKTQTPWSAAADAGVAIGRGSRRAGVETAGFFSRLGKRIAGSF